MNLRNATERYKPNELTKDAPIASEAEVKHFIPEKDGRDRFGNFLFTSDNLAYLDGVKDKVKAGILVSPEGFEFMRKYPGIMREIEKALSLLETPDGKNTALSSWDLKSGGTLSQVTIGGQSIVYTLTIDNDKYVIKTHRPSRDGWVDGHQPYLNEMLQTQSMNKDLKAELDFLGIKMSSFLFASGQVSCTRYEEDEKNYDALRRERLEELKIVALGYLLEKRSNHDPLWEHIVIDLRINDIFYWAVDAIKNFRTKEDGTLVWIDPFIFDRRFVPEK